MNGLPESIQALCTFQHSPLPTKVFLMEGGISVQRLFCLQSHCAFVSIWSSGTYHMCLGACPQPSSSNFQNNQCQIKTRMLIPAKHFTQQKFISCKSKRVVFHTQLSVTTHPSITLKMVSINKHGSRSSRSCIVLTSFVLEMALTSVWATPPCGGYQPCAAVFYAM